MTICVSVKVGEGLVLAADSAIMMQGVVQTPQGPRTEIIQTFSFGNKVTHFKDYPIGILNWGLGSINARSIQSLIMEFEYSYPSRQGDEARPFENTTYTVKEIADKLLTFLKDRYNITYPAGSEQPAFGLMIGGYSSQKFFAELYAYEFPTYTDWQVLLPDQVDGSPAFGPNWFGMTDALTRLLNGYDLAAMNELVNRGADKQVVQQWISDSVADLPLVFDGMPLQDAIDFAEYAVQVTIGRFRFGMGPPLCGGDVDIAVVTPNAFRWAKRKQWGIHHE